MPAIIHLSDIWECTLIEILNHDPKSQMGIIMRAWVKLNNMEDFISLLTYEPNDFTPSGLLCNYKEKADSEAVLIMSNTPVKELYDLRRYIQHLILESEYDYDVDEFDSPLNQYNWLLQTQGKSMKIVIYHSSKATESKPTSNQKLFSFKKGRKRRKLPILHSRMKGILMASAEVYILLLSHMNVNKC